MVVSKGGHGWQPGFHGLRREDALLTIREIGRTKRHRAADTVSRLPGFNPAWPRSGSGFLRDKCEAFSRVHP